MQSPALEGVPQVGSPVKVNALRLENGLLFARKIEGEVEDQGVTQRRVEIRGVIERIEQDRTIVIDTVPVKIVALTEVEGELNEGVFAQVEAFLLDDKTLVARAVRVEETDEATERSAVRFEGTVEKVNDDDTFVVNGIKVTTTARSDVKGDVTEGASVQIEGVLSDDGSVMAEVLRGENRRATESRTEVKIEGAIEAIRYDEQRNARFPGRQWPAHQPASLNRYSGLSKAGDTGNRSRDTPRWRPGSKGYTPTGDQAGHRGPASEASGRGPGHSGQR